MYTFGPSYGLEPLEPSRARIVQGFYGKSYRRLSGGAEAWRGWFKTRL